MMMDWLLFLFLATLLAVPILVLAVRLRRRAERDLRSASDATVDGSQGWPRS
jgi:hypothetical protein